MTWYTWKFWRLAKSPNRDGTTWDADGRWVPLGHGLWWLAERAP